MMRTNKLMQKILNENRILQRVNALSLEPRLVSLISSGIVEISGCYFLHALIPDGFDLEEATQSAFDQTEIECTINHIHVNDFINQLESNNIFLIEQGVRYAFLLQKILPKSMDFEIIFSCTFEPIIDCNIRFHKQRLGEEWLADNLENYEEALMLLGQNY